MASANPDTHVDVTVQIKAPPAQLDAQLRDLCRRLCGPTWAGAQDSDLSIRAISGGITNLLFKVSHAPSGSAALVRIFGEKTEVLIDREKDNRTFALLAERGFAPTFYGTFTNGRVEGWVESRPLEPAEMAAREPVDFVALIARETARMHVLDMPDERTPILWRVSAAAGCALLPSRQRPCEGALDMVHACRPLPADRQPSVHYQPTAFPTAVPHEMAGDGIRDHLRLCKL
jgi:hypothetical protein